VTDFVSKRRRFEHSSFVSRQAESLKSCEQVFLERAIKSAASLFCCEQPCKFILIAYAAGMISFLTISAIVSASMCRVLQ
jgi:hypothetical protein